MSRIQKSSRGAVCAAVAALAAFPASADQITLATPPSVQPYQIDSTQYKDGASPNSVELTGGGSRQLTNTSNSYSGGTIVLGNSTLLIDADAELGATTGSITLGSPTDSGTLNLTLSPAAVTSARPITLNGSGTIVAGTNAWTLEGIVSGSGSLTVTSAAGTPGTLVLSGVNTYTGGTTVSGGATLSIAGDSNLGAATGALTLGDSSTTGTITLTNTAAATSARSVILGAGGGVINTGNVFTLLAPVSGAGGLTVEGAGSLVLDAANTYSGMTVLSTGGLVVGDAATAGASIAGDVTVNGGTLSGRGSIIGLVVNNSGTVAPGNGIASPGSLTVGAYTQAAGGTLAIALSPTAVSQLTVNGPASLAGTLQLNSSGTFQSGSTQLISATTITGAFTKVNEISVGLEQSLVEKQLSNGTYVEDLVLTQLSSLPENPSVLPAVINVAIDDAQAATGTVLSHLTDERLSAAVDEMRIVNDPHRAGYSAGTSPYGAWMKGLGGFGSTSGNGTSPGYDVNGGGLVVGIDEGFGAGKVAGIAISYTRTTVSEGGGASGRVDVPRFIAYGGWWVGPVAIDGTLGVGYADLTSRRPIAAVESAAAASFGGAQASAALQASSTLDLGAVQLVPSAGVQYVHFGEHAFSETGAAAYDLSADSATRNSLRPFIAATASTRFLVGYRTAIEPTLRAKYEIEALNGAQAVDVRAPNDAETFAYSGISPARGRLDVDGGVTVETSLDLGFFADVGVIRAGSTTGTKIDAGARYRF